jgi:hypothetical protein|tara:strand:- start:58 stop:360 length:303 start_codon:yes stop_codon:yes gene_type:complete
MYNSIGWAFCAWPFFLVHWASHLNAVTLCTLIENYFRIPYRQKHKEKAMKTLTASLFALVLSAPFAWADGCGSHSKEASMSCSTGQAWNAEEQQCVDTSA